MAKIQIESTDYDMHELCGAQLKEARIQAKCSLQEIADKLRIRKLYLEAIENGDWNVIPSETYARGYIKIYCNFLQMDYQSLLYSAEQNVSNNNIAPSEEIKPPPPRLLPNKWIIAGCLFLVSTALLLVNLYL